MMQKACRYFLLLILSGLLAACSHAPVGEYSQPVCQTSCTLAPQKATSKPYQIKGIWYYPQPHFEYDEIGIASYYGGGDVFHGRPTATGETFSMNGLTAAHKTLPLPCIAEVTNLENGRQICIKVNDRGPFIEGRIIDVSRRVAQLLGFEGKGTARVRVRTLVLQSLALNSSPSSPAPVMVATAAAPSLTIASLIPSEKDARPPKKVASRARVVPARKTRTAGIFVDVGEFTTLAQATQVCQQLSRLEEVPLQPVEKRSQKPYAVRAGPFGNMEKANQASDKFGATTGHLSRIVIIHP